MDKWLLLFLIALTVYRLSELFAIDDGPYDIFERLRQYLMMKSNEHVGEDRLFSELAKGIQCRYCNSVWFAIICSIFWFHQTRITNAFFVIGGIAGLASLLITVGGRKVEE